ncbi:F-actin-capping protein subunit alpha [Malassezia vespertilionis]|uniref:F-actin-capping protein subunit alpha n=1 Tax=Malassezia vespertilionis TaxID=2020962 RepID=A0A2N1JDH1_9BASI|nr:F-actin-capping protein subunit alpha [Malassezia vespertilionis]PKI84597.1 Cap1p [Malassezia vespertilionis]WFD06438.1 F-actin-capping protein subunit alpha [Malassezia vespertilionis]
MSAAKDSVAECLPMLLQAPPGQLKNVTYDLKNILLSTGANANLEEHMQPYLGQHHCAQLSVANIKRGDQSDDAIICDAAKIETPQGLRYVHPRMQVSFAYDYANDTVSDVQPLPAQHALETLRAAVDEQLRKYLYNHFHNGVSSVFVPTASAVEKEIEAPQDGRSTKKTESEEGSTEHEHETDPAESANESEKQGAEISEPAKASETAQEETVDKAQAEAPDSGTISLDTETVTLEQDVARSLLTLHVVGNKYNLRNYWSGRWRSTYVYDTTTHTFLEAKIELLCHYFENGNVQMHTKVQALPTYTAPSTDPAALASAIVSAIERYEQAYQTSLFDTTDELRERAFKLLRRTLPITRQKIDWEKAVSYKLGSELANKP